MKLEHSMVIQWSPEDQLYIVSFPEFPGSHTHGASYEEAAKNAAEVMELLIQLCNDRNQPVPEPASFGCPVAICA
jgi:predicted RNase H-like HicB family nuclease